MNSKNEKIQEIFDIKFRKNVTLKGAPTLTSQEALPKIKKNKIFRQYMTCSKKQFDLWPGKDDLGRRARSRGLSLRNHEQAPNPD